jgi:SAM-dependent methyltransferase
MAPAHAHYDQKLASVYDQMYPIQADTDQAVGHLAGLLPRAGRLLELGLGTGRVAVPLAERGFHVRGVDDSEAMSLASATPGNSSPRAGGFVLQAFDPASYRQAGEGDVGTHPEALPEPPVGPTGLRHL